METFRGATSPGLEKTVRSGAVKVIACGAILKRPSFRVIDSKTGEEILEKRTLNAAFCVTTMTDLNG